MTRRQVELAGMGAEVSYKQYAHREPKPPMGVPAYVQRGPFDWKPAVLHIAFLAIRVASIGCDSTLLSSPVKVAPTFRASTFAAQAGTVIQLLSLRS